MSQTEPAHTRSAIITELACISAELADMQVRNAEISTRVSRIIRDLSCTTATIPPGADLKQLRERLNGVRGRLEATAGEIRNSAERMPPAAQAAPPSDLKPAAQNEGQPESARKAPDEVPERDVGRRTAGQSGEFVTSAGAGGASAASADSAPAADATKREPSVRTAGGGLVQDGGSTKPAFPIGDTRSARDRVIDLYADEGLTTRELAKRTGAPEGSVGGWLSIGRKAGDQRVIDGDVKRGVRKPVNALQPTPREIADAAKPIDPAPAAPAPAIPTGGIEIPAGKLIAVRGAEVHAPTGIWRTSKEIAKAFGLIADGQLYGLETMARHGGLDPRVCIGLIPMWQASLSTIGIELHHHKGYGVRLRAIGGQA